MLKEFGRDIRSIFKRRNPQEELQKDIEDENHLRELVAQYMEGEITLQQYSAQTKQLFRIDLRRIAQETNYR